MRSGILGRRAVCGCVRACNQAGQALLDLLYPRRCWACQAPTPARLPACAPCLQALPHPTEAEVRQVWQRVPGALDALDEVHALWSFTAHGMVQSLQHALKYGNRPTYGHALGTYLQHALPASVPPTNPLLVPVPLHRLRLLERGYNQSTWLAQGLADATGMQMAPGVLTRPRATRTQTRRGRTERRLNLAGAFAVPQPSLVAGHPVVLVDDVLTTGATLVTAAQALREAGATHILGLVLALADR
ncbi:MAG: phosphoribosyltransferase family protein [Bacteroidota bacterium]